MMERLLIMVKDIIDDLYNIPIHQNHPNPKLSIAADNYAIPDIYCA